ncbi:MAG: cell division topological specificity factor MinE [Bacillota bacterium]
MGLKKDEKKKKDKGSKNIAKKRLQFILVQDRIQLSPKEMESLQQELLEVIARYIEVEDRDIDMEINREDEMMALTANIPIKNN